MIKRGTLLFLSFFIINPILILGLQNLTLSKDSKNLAVAQTLAPTESRLQSTNGPRVSSRSPASIPQPMVQSPSTGTEKQVSDELKSASGKSDQKINPSPSER